MKIDREKKNSNRNATVLATCVCVWVIKLKARDRIGHISYSSSWTNLFFFVIRLSTFRHISLIAERKMPDEQTIYLICDGPLKPMGSFDTNGRFSIQILREETLDLRFLCLSLSLTPTVPVSSLSGLRRVSTRKVHQQHRLVRLWEWLVAVAVDVAV